jgi:hypothetical protein
VHTWLSGCGFDATQSAGVMPALRQQFMMVAGITSCCHAACRSRMTCFDIGNSRCIDFDITGLHWGCTVHTQIALRYTTTHYQDSAPKCIGGYRARGDRTSTIHREGNCSQTFSLRTTSSPGDPMASCSFPLQGEVPKKYMACCMLALPVAMPATTTRLCCAVAQMIAQCCVFKAVL